MLSEMPETTSSTPEQVRPKEQPPKFASAAIYTYGTQVAAAALSLLNIIVVSRVLGPGGRGDVVFLTAVPQLSANFVMFGVQEANANFAASEPGLRRALATNSILFAGGFGAVCILVVVGLIAVFPAVGGHVDGTLLLFALLSIPVLVLQTYLQFLITADYRFRVANNTYLITPLGNVLVNGALAATHALSVAAAYGTWFGGQLLATAFFVWYVGRRIAGYGRPDRRLGMRTLRFGFKSYLGRTMMFGNYRLDQWLMGSMASARELGLYSIAVAWSEMLFYLPTALVQVQRPYLVRASKAEAGRRAALVFRAGVLLTAPMAAVLILAAPFVAGTLFGSAFGGASNQLRVLCVGAFGIVALKQLSNALTAQKRPGLGSVAVAVSLLGTVVLDLLLIPDHGGLGAAVASTVGYSVGGVVIVLIFLRIFALRTADVVPARRDLRELALAARGFLRRRPTRASVAPAPAEDRA
jgi:O-antigen/teichoic acid export membrane protein